MLWNIICIPLVLLILWRCIKVALALPDATPADDLEEEYRQALDGYKQAAITYRECGPEYTGAAIYDWCAASERLRVALAKCKMQNKNGKWSLRKWRTSYNGKIY